MDRTRKRPEFQITLSEEQKLIQARWHIHKHNANAEGLDTTEIGPHLDGIIKFTWEFAKDTTISKDLKEQAEQLHRCAKAVAAYIGGEHEDAFKAGFVTGMLWEQFKYHAGIGCAKAWRHR